MQARQGHRVGAETCEGPGPAEPGEQQVRRPGRSKGAGVRGAGTAGAWLTAAAAGVWIFM